MAQTAFFFSRLRYHYRFRNLCQCSNRTRKTQVRTWTGLEGKHFRKLQLNLIRSHATGYGKPLTPSQTRMLLALRINVLAKGYSGISVDNIKKMIAAFNGKAFPILSRDTTIAAYCVSFVPQQGTVGCSGDLCPLAHLALGLLGEGKMWSPSTGWDAADVVLKKNGLEPLLLGPKEGLALINGTQMVTALGALGRETSLAALSPCYSTGASLQHCPAGGHHRGPLPGCPQRDNQCL